MKVFLKLVVRAPLLFICHYIYRVMHTTSSLRGVWFEAMGAGGYCVSTVGPVRYLISTSDKVVSKSVYKTGEYDSNKLNQLTEKFEILKSKRILVDVGANIGTIALSALSSDLFDHVVAIEPNPLNFKLLSINVLLNDFGERVRLKNVAVGAYENEQLIMELSPENFGDHRVRVIDQQGKDSELQRSVIKVPSTTLDELLSVEDTSSLLVWMDTQGYEANVLSGAIGLISSNVPFVIEFWPYGLRRADSFELLKSNMQNFSWFVDLSDPDLCPIPMSEIEINKLADSVGWKGRYTDIFLFN